MRPTLNRCVCFSRYHFRWIGVPALVLGFCALTQVAPGQAQLGAAESCFDQGPDKLPARVTASLPPPPAALPTSVTTPHALIKIHPKRMPAKKLPGSLRENALNGSRPMPGTRNSAASLTPR